MLKTVTTVAVMLLAFLAGVPIALVAGVAYTLFTPRGWASPSPCSPSSWAG